MNEDHKNDEDDGLCALGWSTLAFSCDSHGKYFMRRLHFWPYFDGLHWIVILESSKIVSCRSHYCLILLLRLFFKFSFVAINCACLETLMSLSLPTKWISNNE